MLGHHDERRVAPLRVRRKLAQLDRQALLQAARRDSGRIEALELLEHRLDSMEAHLLVPGIEALADVFQRKLEIAVVVDGIDERGRNDPVGVAEPHQRHLPVETILERLGLRTVGEEVHPVELPARPRAADRGRVVDVLPHGVDRKLAGYVARSDIGLRTGVGGVVFVRLQHEVGVERLLDFGVQLHGGELEQPDRLL